MINLEISVASNDDLNGIINLETEYGKEVYSFETVKKDLENPIYNIFVAKCNNEIVGYLSATIIFEECNLLKIITLNKYKRQGVASKLFYRLIEACQKQDVHHIYLEVRQNNLSAIAFYEYLGFTFENIRKRYYGDEDAIIYGMNI